jgi:hypothetical protein
MKTVPRINRKKFLIGVGICFCVILMLFGQSIICHLFPAFAFRQITGRPIPSGIQVTAYGSAMTDNLFHTTHYWLLTGSPSGLREIIIGTGFAESEDGGLPDMLQMFGVSLTETKIDKCFEWELDRDRWYFIFQGGTNALYAH